LPTTTWDEIARRRAAQGDWASDGYDDQRRGRPVVPSPEVGDFLFVAPAELFLVVMAPLRDPAPPERAALGGTGSQLVRPLRIL
jgi:hypothetical protein